MRASRTTLTTLGSLLAVPLLLATSCAPVEDDTTASEEPTPTATGGGAEASATPASCAAGRTLTEGTLTVATDSPAFDPWFRKDDPTNGQGFESAVAYAVAGELGFGTDQVDWVTVPFNTSYKPGPKDFDFDINQISITAARAEVVDFSDGYYQAAQAVIALQDNPAADATTLADLADLKLGAQTGTTSLTAIRDVIAPTQDEAVFEDTNIAKQQLLSGQVDAILSDLPTAFYITAVEIPKASIIGQFQPETGGQEEFGMLFEKGNPLVGCVNEALAALESDGSLAAIEQEWLSDTVGVPQLQ